MLSYVYAMSLQLRRGDGVKRNRDRGPTYRVSQRENGAEERSLRPAVARARESFLISRGACCAPARGAEGHDSNERDA